MSGADALSEGVATEGAAEADARLRDAVGVAVADVGERVAVCGVGVGDAVKGVSVGVGVDCCCCAAVIVVLLSRKQFPVIGPYARTRELL